MAALALCIDHSRAHAAFCAAARSVWSRAGRIAVRHDPRAVAFVKSFFDSGKPVAAICHGPWTVIETGAAKGHRMTSWPSLKTDIRNAGAEWVDEEVVIDGTLITSRKPDDVPAFNRALLEVFGDARSAHA